MIKKLAKMPYAQARVSLCDDGSVYLISYQTIVAIITPDGWLQINGLYAATTRKHLKAFCSEYCGIDLFSTIRLLANEHMIYNIYTGEVVERGE